LKPSRAPGTPIDTKRLRGWTQSFASYRHQVSEQAIGDWLAQFQNGHRDVAARLLDVIDFYTADRISAAFRTSLASLPGWDFDEKKRQGTWRFAALSRSAGESGDAMMHRFRVANGMDAKRYNHIFIHPSQIVLEKLGSDDKLVLIDDFVGTGDSVCSAWRESFEELVAGIGKVYLVVVAAVSGGRAKIGSQTSITCVAGHELTKGDNIFAAECDKFSAVDKTSMMAYCKRAHKKEPRGYGNCGLVLVFQHRCPNNTLPIFHVDNGKWTGIFPRHG
jgi:hypothetical protein